MLMIFYFLMKIIIFVFRFKVIFIKKIFWSKKPPKLKDITWDRCRVLNVPTTSINIFPFQVQSTAYNRMTYKMYSECHNVGRIVQYAVSVSYNIFGLLNINGVIQMSCSMSPYKRDHCTYKKDTIDQCTAHICISQHLLTILNRKIVQSTKYRIWYRNYRVIACRWIYYLFLFIKSHNYLIVEWIIAAGNFKFLKIL